MLIAESPIGQSWEQTKKAMAYFIPGDWEVVIHPLYVRGHLQEIETIPKATHH